MGQSLLSVPGRGAIVLGAQGVEQVGQAVVIDLVHQGQQAAQLALGKAFAGKPVQVGAGQVSDDPALVLAEGHLLGDQQFEFFRVHCGAVTCERPGIENTCILHAGQMTDHAKRTNTVLSIYTNSLKLKAISCCFGLA
ncbi:hypothetical protein D3C85_953140 [compost metagenome]